MGNTSPVPRGDGGGSPARDAISVYVVEDNRLLREGIVALLARQADLAVVGAAPSSVGALPGIRQSRPRIVLMDAGLGEDDSERLVESIVRTVPTAGIIVMDLLPDQEAIDAFSGAGVRGFIMKDATTDEMVRVIRAVAAGEKVVPDPAADSLLFQIARQAADRPLRGVVRAVIMTKRERRIIALIAEGKSNREIARQLHVGQNTVRGYVHNIVNKLALWATLQSEIDFPT